MHKDPERALSGELGAGTHSPAHENPAHTLLLLIISVMAALVLRAVINYKVMTNGEGKARGPDPAVDSRR